MRKEEQIRINVLCEAIWNNAMKEYHEEFRNRETPWRRLRSCKAFTVETDNYIYLKSYKTIIAVIDKKSDTLYDLLRGVYGYTSTSAQHISKFNRDCGAGKWGCEVRFTYREV